MRNQRRAGFWIRLLATALDLIAVVLFGPLAIIIATAAHRRGAGAGAATLIVQGFFYSAVLLYSTLEIWTAATPGKLLLGLRIATIDGSIADPWRRTLRWSSKQMPIVFSALFAVTGFGGFYLLAGFTSLIIVIGCLFASNDDHLTWHDQWAGTSVVHRARRPTTGFAVLPPPLPVSDDLASIGITSDRKR